MGLPIEQDYRQLAAQGMNRHEAITTAFVRMIVEGRLAPGTRLPTVRSLSSQLGVSGATVATAYRMLNQRGWVRGEVGRGTFVVGPRDVPPPNGAPVARNPWRRRTVLASAARLRSMYPDALDCTSGKPDPTLLHTGILMRSWRAALDETDPQDLQYASPEPVPALADAILRRLDRDGISGAGVGMVVGSSAQQLMVLSLAVTPAVNGSNPKVVAVEEPGYQTVFDAFEYVGYRLVGMTVDGEGVRPQALDMALASGARAVLFTPRAHNPTGASWSPARRIELSQVLSRYPGVIAIEDDQFADLARGRPGSLLNHPQLADRVIYIRSFSKAIAPDLRVAVGVAQPRLVNLLTEAKSFTDGWSSRLSQRALAHLLTDPDLDPALDASRRVYDHRREVAKDILAEHLARLGGSVRGEDGLSLWVQLCPGMDAGNVIERAGGQGVLVTPGEPFFIRPGRNDVLRMSISNVDEAGAIAAAGRLASVLQDTSAVPATTIPI